MNKEGLKAVNYWIRPLTRVRIKELSRAYRKPVGRVIESLVDKAYETFRETQNMRGKGNGAFRSKRKTQQEVSGFKKIIQTIQKKIL